MRRKRTTSINAVYGRDEETGANPHGVQSYQMRSLLCGAAAAPSGGVRRDRHKEKRLCLPGRWNVKLTANALKWDALLPAHITKGPKKLKVHQVQPPEKVLPRTESKRRRSANQIHNYYLLIFSLPPIRRLSIERFSPFPLDHPDAVIQTRKNYWSGILERPTGGGQ